MKNKKTDIRSDRGQTMVEFALVVPVFLLVIFGIIQCGILYNNYVTLADATRVGARKAAVSRQAVDPVGLAKAATRKSASGLKTPPLEVFVTATAWAPGADVTVEATYPYELKILWFVAASGTLSSKTTERVE